jgi:hypothetical protein
MSWEGVSSRPHRFGGIEDVLVALDILNVPAYNSEDPVGRSLNLSS